jgi:heme-degrading monooxygenase HmoA
MIVRTWNARARAENVDAYIRHFDALLKPALSNLAGFVGASILQRPADDNGNVQIVVMTRWKSIEAIRGFAGADISVAVVEPAAAAVLISYDRHVEHFTVAYELAI